MSNSRAARLTLVTAGAVLLVGALAFRTFSMRSRISPPSQALQAAPPPPPSSTGGSRVVTTGNVAPNSSARTSGSPPTPSVPSVGRQLQKQAFTIRTSVLRDVESTLSTKGGQAALDLIRAQSRTANASWDARFRALHFVRLIAFAAKKDPTCSAAALQLSMELATDPARDEFVRFQALAGLAGASSTNPTVGSDPAGVAPTVVAFSLDDADLTDENPYDASLSDAARTDRALQDRVVHLLATDPSYDVRRAAVAAAGRMATPQLLFALESAVASDPESEVREAAVRALADADPVGFPKRVRSLVDRERDGQTLRQAFDLLKTKIPFDPEVDRLLRDSATTPALSGVRFAVADSIFSYLEAGQGGELRPLLLPMLLNAATDPKLVGVFAERTVAAGWTEYLPIYASLLSTLPSDAPAREILSAAIRKLEQAPRYASLADQLRRSTADAEKLVRELDRKDLSPAQREEATGRLNALFDTLVHLRDDFRK